MIKDDVERIKICRECKGRFVSIHELLHNRDCNFCDVPYIILEIHEKERGTNKWL